MNPKELEDLLQQFLTKIGDEIKENIPNASGSTANSIEVTTEVDGSGYLTGYLKGAPYIMALEDGRRPTREGATSSEKTLRERILEWISYRGFSFPMQPKYSWGKVIKDADQLSWAIAISIHKKGTLLYQRGGKSGVISNVITDSRIEAFEKAFAGKVGRLILNDIVRNKA